MTKRLLAACGMALFLAGCGSVGKEGHDPKFPKVVPTRGKVLTAKGEPVRLAVLAMTPVKLGEKPVPCEGKIGPDGTFEMRTFSNLGPDGVVPGEYLVYLKDYDAGVYGNPPKGVTPAVIPAKYKSDKTSGWTAEIKPGEEIELEFKMTE